jgi:hypothetical protein
VFNRAMLYMDAIKYKIKKKDEHERCNITRLFPSDAFSFSELLPLWLKEGE